MAIALKAPRWVVPNFPDIESPARAAPPGEARPKPHLRALTGLRFLAALLVVIYHFLRLPAASGTGPLPVATRALQNLIASGFTGVSFFFILSGFILAYNYIDTDRQTGLRVSSRRFWLARLARIYPLYLLALAVAFIPYLGWGAYSAQTCAGGPAVTPQAHPAVTGVAGMFLLQAWLPCAMRWNPPGWSLSAEAFFYLLFPFIALWVARLRRRRSLAVMVIGAWGVALALSLGYFFLQPDAGVRQGWAGRYWSWVLYSDPLMRLPEFLMGMALGRLFLERHTSAPGTTPRGLGRLFRPRLVAPLAAAGILLVLCTDCVPETFYKIVVLDPLFALLVYSLAFGEGLLAVALSLPAAVLLGEASYAVYILHWPLRTWVTHVAGVLPLPNALQPSRDPAFFVPYLCIVLALAVLSWRFVERPAQRAIKRRFQGTGESQRRERQALAGS